MNENPSSEERVKAWLESLSSRDRKYKGGRILRSMCTTPHPISADAFRLFVESNLGDPELFPASASLERLAVSELCGIMGCRNAYGNIVSGGSEANYLACLNARFAVGGSNIVVPETVHYCFDKASRLFGFEVRRARVDRSGEVDVGDMEGLVDGDTFMVLGIVGSTELGSIDPIPEIAEMARRKGVWMHVDAAFGGLVVPFLRDLGLDFPPFGFQVPGVSSITVDPHKMGLAPVPAGAILFREEPALRTRIPYTVGEFYDQTLLGTRPAFPSAAICAIFRILGRKGLRDLVADCWATTQYLAARLAEVGAQPVCPPRMNILAFKLGTREETRGAAEWLAAKGWYLAYSERIGAIRVVVMPHVTRKVVDQFLISLKKFRRPRRPP